MSPVAFILMNLYTNLTYLTSREFWCRTASFKNRLMHPKQGEWKMPETASAKAGASQTGFSSGVLTAHLDGARLQSVSVALAIMIVGSVLLLVLLTAAQAVPAAAAGTSNLLKSDLLPEDCGRRLVQPEDLSKPYVVGTGNVTAYYGQYPWQARVEVLQPGQIRYVHQCGGIIITRRHVITAAHCVDHVPLASIEVRVGDLRFDRRENAEQAFGVNSFYVHSQFGNGTSFANDIALLQLRVRRGDGIEFGRFVQPACLPEADTNYEPNTECEVSGWGQTADGAPISETLGGASVPLVSDGFCSALEVHQVRFVPGRMFCAGLITGGPDACGGDSGGPLVCRDPTNDRFVAFGIVSSGHPKGCGRLPGLYTKLSGYVSWLLPRLRLDVKDISGAGVASVSDSNPATNVSADTRIDCGRSDFSLTEDVTGGYSNDASEFPWLLAIFAENLSNDGPHLCSGSIISDRWILTDEICARDAFTYDQGPSHQTPFAAVRNAKTGAFVRKFGLIGYVEHPNNILITPRGLALLQTSSPMPLHDGLQPICLPDKQIPDVQPGTTIVFASWSSPLGRYSEPERAHDIPLLWATMTVVGDIECRRHITDSEQVKKIPREGTFCATFEQPVNYDNGPCDTHIGDSGMPVLAKVTENGVTRFYAIALRQFFFFGCGTEFKHGWYVHLSRYYDWIRAITSRTK